MAMTQKDQIAFARRMHHVLEDMQPDKKAANADALKGFAEQRAAISTTTSIPAKKAKTKKQKTAAAVN